MRKTLLLAGAIAVAAIPSLAFADVTAVAVPVGDWTAAVAPTVEAVLTAGIGIAITWLLRFVPASMQAFVTQATIAQAEQLLGKAVDYGINTVVGAEKGKTLEINVGNAVAAQGVQYVLSHGPTWLIDWLGGADAIQQKLIARLQLVAGAAPAAGVAAPVAVPAAVVPVAPAVPVKGVVPAAA